MAVVLLIHLDRVVRERIEDALKARGLSVTASADIESALLTADIVDISAVLVDPRILLKESYDIGSRFEVRAKKPVRIIALTHVAGATEAQAFQRHGASLLIAPLDDLELLALYLNTGQENVATDSALPAQKEELPAEKNKLRPGKPVPKKKPAAAPDLGAPGSTADADDTIIPSEPARESTMGEPHRGGAAMPGWGEDTNVQRRPELTPASDEEQISPEMEAALERARAEVARIRKEHDASRAAKEPRIAEARAARDAAMRYEAPADPREELLAIAAPPGVDGQAPRVLVIEDDLGCRDFFQDVLAARGYRVHSCASVPAALRYLQRGNRVDLILSDINMPIFDGFEMKWMLDNEARLAGFGAIPFVAVSAEDTPEKYSLALRLGAIAMIPKPVKNLRGFCKLVRSTLEQTGDKAAAGPAR